MLGGEGLTEMALGPYWTVYSLRGKVKLREVALYDHGYKTWSAKATMAEGKGVLDP